MKTKTLHQSISLEAMSRDVYEALMGSKKYAELLESREAGRQRVAVEL